MTIQEIAEAMVNNETVLLIYEEDEIPCKIEAIYRSGAIYIRIKNMRIQDDYKINDFKRKTK